MSAQPATVAKGQRKPSRKGGVGRGLSWLNDEVTALIVQGYIISSDPAVGAGQTVEKYAERMWAAFIEKAPVDACLTDDHRRWAARPAMACLKKYKLVVRTCAKMFESRKRVDAMKLTGSPTEEDINRVALALFNDALPVGDKELVYSILSTPRFNVGKTFEYQDQYEFLVKHTTLLDAGISPGSPSHQNSTIALQPTSPGTT